MELRALPPTAIAALTGLAIAGCGSSGDSSSAPTTQASAPAKPAKTVNQQQVEQGLEQSLSTSQVKVTKASCPANVPVKVGGTFTCNVTFSDDAIGKVKVTQKGGNRYSYTVENGSVQIPGQSVATELEKDLAAQGVPNATVTCPQTIIVKTGSTVTCNVSGAQGAANGSVTFEFSNAEGTVNQSSVKSS